MITREDAVQQYEGLNYKQLAAHYRELEALKKDLKAQQAELTARWDALTIDVLPDKLAEDGFKNVNIDGVGRIQTSTQAYCSTKAGMAEALREWMVEHGFGELISEMINPSTLKSFIKEQMEHDGEVPPDDLVNYQPYSRASIVKS